MERKQFVNKLFWKPYMVPKCKYAKPELDEDESYFICRLMGGKVDQSTCSGCCWKKEE